MGFACAADSGERLRRESVARLSAGFGEIAVVVVVGPARVMATRCDGESMAHAFRIRLRRCGGAARKESRYRVVRCCEKIRRKEGVRID